MYTQLCYYKSNIAVSLHPNYIRLPPLFRPGIIFLCLFFFYFFFLVCSLFFFFFQAEDGIRDGRVTGVQTCALPICAAAYAEAGADSLFVPGLLDLAVLATLTSKVSLPVNVMAGPGAPDVATLRAAGRSEERRVGKECRSGWSRDHERKKQRKEQGAV